MGNLADDWMISCMDEDDFLGEDTPNWETKEGELLRIKDMETSHIENTIRLLRRKDREGYESYNHLVIELMVRKLLPHANRNERGE